MNLNAQNAADYPGNWKKIEEFEKKGLTASALKEVISLFNLAVAAGNEVQQIKAAMYQMKYRNMVEQDNKVNNIFFIDTLIAKTKAPAKNILQSMQAELLWNYRQQNRYRFYNRTGLTEEKSDDITTWSIDKLDKTIAERYKASIKNSPLLKSTPVNSFDGIMQKGENTRLLRPTLYDFLAHRALEYFMNSENEVTSPAYKFILNDERVFSPVKNFIHIAFTTKDSGSLYYNAVLLLQDILSFHINDNDPAALLDADLARLAFMNDHGVFANKDQLYEQALKNIEAEYNNNPWTAQAIFLRAELHYNKSLAHEEEEHINSGRDMIQAKQLCDEAIKRFPGSYGALNCQNLINTIETPQLNFETEKVNIPGQPFKSLITYKNISRVYLRVIKTDRDEIRSIEQKDYDKIWPAYTNLKPLRSWSINIPDVKDYQQHSVEIKIDPLAHGTYVILASIDVGFGMTDNIICKGVSLVSNISYIDNQNELYVLDRDNGEPLAKAEVQLWQRKYNSVIRTYEEIKYNRYQTDNNGYVKLENKSNNNGFFLQVKYREDELFTDDWHYFNSYNSYTGENNNKTFLFTDRSIYRPGQTVFLKGIVIDRGKEANKSNIVANYKSRLVLYNTNGEKIDAIAITSNKYGSFNGSFKLPSNGLNGMFTISDSASRSQINISVEEYKRPKFIVEIKKPAGTYRLNDSISVTGTAKAYSGNSVDGAAVKYRVVRKVQYPLWVRFGYDWSRPAFNTTQMEITNGETIANANGEFSITFKAIPDESTEKKNQPVFYYEITADITDLNGETRSGHTSVAVSYQAIQLNIITGEKTDSDSLKNIKIQSSNINGLFEKTIVTLSLQKLKSPDRIYRERYWQAPDQFVMSKEEHDKSFPYDPYAEEDNIYKWINLGSTLTITDSTSENMQFNIHGTKQDAGWYKLRAVAKDKFGEEVVSEKYIMISDNEKIPAGESFAFHTKTLLAEPGQQVAYTISTGYEKVWLIHNTINVDKTVKTSHPLLTKEHPYRNELNITENDRGGIAVDYAFVQHNRFYHSADIFDVPWSNKDLKISYETFRDKILPGSSEKWKIRLSGNKSEKIAAEALISMYDASLDQYRPHTWETLRSLFPQNTGMGGWNANTFTAVQSRQSGSIYRYVQLPAKSYDALAGNGWNDDYYYRDEMRLAKSMRRDASVDEMMLENASPEAVSMNVTQGLKGKVSGSYLESSDKKETTASNGDQLQNETGSAELKGNGNNNIQVRKNFNETAFFLPALNTDADGNIEFSFTIPEALTTWKMMTLAHTKDLSSIYSEKTVITQKPLMVQPNAPRFLREGDRMEFSAKIVNLSGNEITGTVQLELFDAATNKPVDGWFKNMFPFQYFTVAAGKSMAVKFPVDIPFSFNSALTYRIRAGSKDGSFSDGEEGALPVLINRTLVTETMPLNMRNETTKQFKFERLLSSNNSGTLTNHALTVEYTSNPAWYAVQALPYLMEYPYECAEQTYNRYYANTLASFVSNSTPKIKAVFEKWLSPGKETDTIALLSNLQKNEELKSALLQETPWVLEAQTEHEQKKNIAILFDLIRLSKEKENTLNKLKEMQTGNGGFSWFKDGPDDRYITQYIITGIGHLRKLNAITGEDYERLKPIIEKALPYLDARLKEEYDYLKKSKANPANNHLSYAAIQYLYMRSFFKEIMIDSKIQSAYSFYLKQAQQYWLSNNKYMQAMIALALYRTGDKKTPAAIISSLKENAIYKEEMGMYFKEFVNGGFYWYQSPVESQAMIIETFSDIDQNTTTVDDLKTWLLKQKQTQNWKTTKATAEACYALLLNGNNWLTEEKKVVINLGNTVISSNDEKQEAGTGYFKKTIAGEKLQQGMGNITVSIHSSSDQPISKSTSWGAVYWQYFEDLDKITPAETPLKLVKKLFIEKNSDRGPVLQPLKEGDELHIGDKVKVRIELKADRDMEYIHMKDLRAACMEPVNVISRYKWQDGLGYYESTKDASTNFFFGWLPRGSYVFEYPMFVTHSGNFSNGITTIQCMYAPEFTSHSEGLRVNVADR